MTKPSKTLPLQLGIFTVVMSAILFGVYLVNQSKANSTKYVPLAQCLAEKDVKMYGAFWCTHCGDQKAEFGAGAKYLPYVECSNPDHTQNATCDAAGIKNRYPTWVFPDGTHTEGGLSPKQLSTMTGCSLETTANDPTNGYSSLPCTNDGTPCTLKPSPQTKTQ
jgi:hypothetical protein